MKISKAILAMAIMSASFAHAAAIPVHSMAPDLGADRSRSKSSGAASIKRNAEKRKRKKNRK